MQIITKFHAIYCNNALISFIRAVEVLWQVPWKFQMAVEEVRKQAKKAQKVPQVKEAPKVPLASLVLDLVLEVPVRTLDQVQIQAKKVGLVLN